MITTDARPSATDQPDTTVAGYVTVPVFAHPDGVDPVEIGTMRVPVSVSTTEQHLDRLDVWLTTVPTVVPIDVDVPDGPPIEIAITHSPVDRSLWVERAEYDTAVATIARMHAAAVGETAPAGADGPVGDIAELRRRAVGLAEEVERYRQIRRDIRAVVEGRTPTGGPSATVGIVTDVYRRMRAGEEALGHALGGKPLTAHACVAHAARVLHEATAEATGNESRVTGRSGAPSLVAIADGWRQLGVAISQHHALTPAVEQ